MYNRGNEVRSVIKAMGQESTVGSWVRPFGLDWFI